MKHSPQLDSPVILQKQSWIKLCTHIYPSVLISHLLHMDKGNSGRVTKNRWSFRSHVTPKKVCSTNVWPYDSALVSKQVCGTRFWLIQRQQKKPTIWCYFKDVRKKLCMHSQMLLLPTYRCFYKEGRRKKGGKKKQLSANTYVA